MTIFQHPIWKHILPYAHPTFRGVTLYLDFLQLPDDLHLISLNIVTNCVSCHSVTNPLRARAQSERSRIAGSPVERRLCYSPVCLTEVNAGCSRTKAASQHRDLLRWKLVEGGVNMDLIQFNAAMVNPVEDVAQ